MLRLIAFHALLATLLQFKTINFTTVVLCHMYIYTHTNIYRCSTWDGIQGIIIAFEHSLNTTQPNQTRRAIVYAAAAAAAATIATSTTNITKYHISTIQSEFLIWNASVLNFSNNNYSWFCLSIIVQIAQGSVQLVICKIEVRDEFSAGHRDNDSEIADTEVTNVARRFLAYQVASFQSLIVTQWRSRSNNNNNNRHNIGNHWVIS